MNLKTLLWRSSITVAILVIILATFYAEENGRGRQVWKQVEHDIAARGESLNWNDYIPKPVPDDQNFYAAPMMREWFTRHTNACPASLAALMANPDSEVDSFDEISASNYLAWCAAFEPDLNKVREAAKRPAARINGDYTKPFSQPIQNFVSYRGISRVLAHRARCHLLVGQPDKALEDLTLLHDLNFTLAKDGRPATLVEAMIHIAISGLYVNVVACGLNSHSWSEPELEALQEQLSEIHLPPLLVYSFQAERAGACHLVDMSVKEMMHASGAPKPASDLGWWFIPHGWIDQNKTIIATAEGQMIESVDLTNQTISPFKAKATVAYWDKTFQRTTPWNFIASLCIPNFSKAADTTGRNQTWADQAQIVCALERYRLRNGQYPPTLAALVPQFIGAIPKDIISGKPMTYVRKDEQNYLLYSVGWNEADEGGIIARTKAGAEDRDNGDWVWHYPEP